MSMMSVSGRALPCVLCVALCYVVSLGVPQLRAQGETAVVHLRPVTALTPAQDSASGQPSGAATDKRISLELHDVAVKDALREIATQGKVVLFYNDRDIPAERRVSITITNATIADVVRVVLRGTGLTVRPTIAGVVLERRATTPQRQEPRAQQGAIRGTITDSATGAPIGGATVAVNTGEPRTVTDADGAYRLTSVPVGTITLSVRRLGYVPVSRQITVIADGETVVDVRLVAAPQILDEVVTTGTVVPTAVKALPTPISVISAAEIARQPAPRIDQIFRQAVPGAVAPELGAFPQQTTMSVRGASSLAGASGGGTLKIYLDGVELSDRSIAAIDPSSIERIEVIRGPEAAAIYGSDAIGGVMQVFTKRGDATDHDAQIETKLALGTVQSPYAARSALKQNYSMSVHGGTSGVGYNVGASYGRTGDWVPDYFLSEPSVYGGLDLTQERLTLDFSGRYYAQAESRPLDPRWPSTGWAYVSKPYHYRIRSGEATYGAHLRYAQTSRWQHTLSAGVDRLSYDEHSTQPRLTTPADTLLYVVGQGEEKISIAYNTTLTVPLARDVSAVLTAGLDHYSLTTNIFSTAGALNTSGTIQTVPSSPAQVVRDVTTNSGYFLQGQLALHDALFLTGAARVEQNSNFGDDVGTPISPRVGISYVHGLGSATIKLRASYGRAISPPSPDQKSAATHPGQVVLANPLLGPQSQVGGDGGVDLIFGALGSVGVTAYDQIAKGLIQYAPVDITSTPATYQFQNVGRVKNTGVELEGSLHLGRADVKGNYAFTQSRVEALGPNYTGSLAVGDQVILIPRHTASASLTLPLLRRTSLTAWANYVGARSATDYIAQMACFGGAQPCRSSARDYIEEYPGFVKTGLSVTHQVTQAISAFVSVDNLANKNYDEFGNNGPFLGRITMAGVRMTRLPQ